MNRLTLILTLIAATALAGEPISATIARRDAERAHRMEQVPSDGLPPLYNSGGNCTSDGYYGQHYTDANGYMREQNALLRDVALSLRSMTGTLARIAAALESRVEPERPEQPNGPPSWSHTIFTNGAYFAVAETNGVYHLGSGGVWYMGAASNGVER